MGIVRSASILSCILSFTMANLSAQTSSGESDKRQRLTLGRHAFELHNVHGKIVDFQGHKTLRLERDLTAIPFDSNNIEKTVDEPHYARLMGLEDFENGTIEVMLYSQIKNPAPYSRVAGFIGLVFRAEPDDSGFEAIYVRPKVGRAPNQWYRNHAVQYISYPHFKFDTLRKMAPFRYEGSAPVALNEWIKIRIEVNGETSEMFLNDAKYSTFVVDKLLGRNTKGGVGLYVDIGTVGYFKDLKVTRGLKKMKNADGVRVDKL